MSIKAKHSDGFFVAATPSHYKAARAGCVSAATKLAAIEEIKSEREM